MIRTYPDGTVYDSDLTDIELRHPDNAVAMELVEVLRAVSREHGKRTSGEIERLNNLVRNLHTDNVELENQNEELTEDNKELEASVADLQAKLDAIKAVLA